MNGKQKCIHYGELFTVYQEEIKSICSYTNENIDNMFFSCANDVLMPTSDVTPNGLATASCIKENNVIIGGDVLVIRSLKGIVDGIFLSYSIRQDRKQVMQLVSGSTVYHLYGSDMKKFEFKFPTLSEQSAIATILSDTDALITALDALITKKRAIKQGTMQDLMTGRRRLAGYSGEWEVKRLGDVAKIKTGSCNNQDKVENGKYPFFVRSENVERINSYSYDCEAILVP